LTSSWSDTSGANRQRDLVFRLRREKRAGRRVACIDGPGGAEVVTALQRLWGIAPGSILGAGSDGYVCDVQTDEHLVVKITRETEEARITDAIMSGQDDGVQDVLFRSFFCVVVEAAVVRVDRPDGSTATWYAVLRENASPVEHTDRPLLETQADAVSGILQIAAESAAMGRSEKAHQALTLAKREAAAVAQDMGERRSVKWDRAIDLLAELYDHDFWPADLHEGNWGTRRYRRFATPRAGVGALLVYDWGRSAYDPLSWPAARSLSRFASVNPSRSGKWRGRRWRRVHVRLARPKVSRARGRAGS